MHRCRIFLFIFFCTLFTISANCAKPDTVFINGLLDRATLIQSSNQDSSYLLSAKAYLLSQKINYRRGIRRAFIRIGSMVYTNGYHDSALAIINEALHISKSLNDYSGIAGADVLLSCIYQSKGMQDSAFGALYQALRFSAMSGDSVMIMHTYYTLGDLSYYYDDYRVATAYYLKAAKLAEMIKNNQGILSAWMGIGNTNYRLGKFNIALSYYLKADSLSRVDNDAVTIAQNLNNIALSYAELKDFGLAGYYYKAALDEYTRRGMKSETANAYYNLADLYLKRNKADSAVYFLEKSLLMARELNELKRAASCYEMLSNAYALKGNFTRAYNYHLQFTALSDSLLNAEKISSISDMQVKYETEKKEQQITLLDEQNKTRSAQRNFFIAGSVVLLLGFFVLGFYYLQRNKLAKKNEEISQQKISSLLNEQEIKSYNAMIEGQEEERKRIATDLHDRLGSMLSTVKLLFSSLDLKIDKAQDENKMQYERAGNLLDEAVVEVRRISHNLSTGIVMSFGLVPALQELCESIDNSKLIKCKLLHYGMDQRLDQHIEIDIYRIVQELFGNILKHAKAKQITLQLNRVDGSINITVEDDGIGFDVAEKMKSGGMGLKNLEARAAKLNGVFHVDSKPGTGTISIIEIPVISQS